MCYKLFYFVGVESDLICWLTKHISLHCDSTLFWPLWHVPPYLSVTYSRRWLGLGYKTTWLGLGKHYGLGQNSTLTVGFWFYPGHAQRPPRWKSFVCLAHPSVPSYSSCVSSFAAVIITMTTGGWCLTISWNMGHNKPLAQSTYMIFFLMRTSWTGSYKTKLQNWITYT